MLRLTFGKHTQPSLVCGRCKHTCLFFDFLIDHYQCGTEGRRYRLEHRLVAWLYD